jgi:3-deoxy-7-phosphoheptulonate synthase
MNSSNHPYRLALREPGQATTVVPVGAGTIGGGSLAVIAGPCSVESRELALEIAGELSQLGVTMFRGGAFKPRTSPYSFQGMGEEGLQILAEIRERYGMAIVTEAMTPEEVPLVAQYADMLQIGSRNMQNYRLLEACGLQEKPVLLKRGMSATIEEMLCAAEYILAAGNPHVVLCERGLRSFDSAMRGTFDLGALPLLAQLTHLPVIADPSHATGLSELVPAVALGAAAAGADGVIMEVHQRPEQALSDGRQCLTPAELDALLPALAGIAAVSGREIGVQEPYSGHQMELEALDVA